MKRALTFLIILFVGNIFMFANENTDESLDSLRVLQNKTQQILLQDSLRKMELALQINLLRNNDLREKERLQNELQRIEQEDSTRKAALQKETLRVMANIKAHPVVLFNDTIFNIYNKIGSITAKERAFNISNRIKKLYDDDFLKLDSLSLSESENNIDITIGETILVSVSELDALVNNQAQRDLAQQYLASIKQSIEKARAERSFLQVLKRIALILLILTVVYFLIKLVKLVFARSETFVNKNKDKLLRNLAYKDYTFLSAEQEMTIILRLLKILRWTIIALLIYLILPFVFSIFPFTRTWADTLFSLIWSPFRAILLSIWNYLPNIFTIAVIYIVFKYSIRFVKYLFDEIENGKLNISGFHADWAAPTFSILKFLLYAFMFVLIFPYLPGSDSDIFKGVSVFVGVLFSLGSSSAISNMIAGLVITYMRPFKLGDRIRINENTGIVIEKTMLVTRLRTIKNEEITIPNASVLSGNTVNFSAFSKTEGLIIHSTVTIGYDVQWNKMHEALIDAALRTMYIMQEPKPFVWQTSLDDFYVSYQINAYTHEAEKALLILSELHKNIQEICAERGIEIMSPHYRAERDGSESTIPK